MKQDELQALARMLDRLDYYQLLRVERAAPIAGVRAAYHEARRRFHPDLYLAKAPDLREAVDRIARRITEGYMVLRDAARRTAYDRGLDRGKLRYSPESEDAVRDESETRTGKTPNGRRFFGLAADEERKGNLEKAISHLKMALTFEANNKHFQRRLEDLRERVKR